MIFGKNGNSNFEFSICFGKVMCLPCKTTAITVILQNG